MSADASSRDLMGWLWRGYLRRHIGVLAIAFVLMAMEGAAMGALSYMMKPMFDQVFIAGNTGALAWVGAVIFGIFVVRGSRPGSTRSSTASCR